MIWAKGAGIRCLGGQPERHSWGIGLSSTGAILPKPPPQIQPPPLQRRLSEHDASYQTLLDAVRLAVARQMLADTAMENGEIAFYLDFNEANSFHRFFIGQTGKTPNEWRAEKRA
ncbi:helix-turn-helix domain-containing protein [Cardiobacterium hominis]